MLPSVVAKCLYRNLNRCSSDYKLFHSACFASTRVRPEIFIVKSSAWRLISGTAYFCDKSKAKDAASPQSDKSHEKVISQSATGDIVVKTETDSNQVVTKVTIEKKDKKQTQEPLLKQVVAAPPVKKRLLIDFSASYTERNFITPMRAMTEYLLKQSDLESLPKVLRRSPYEAEPPITVYYRKDVESKAYEVWGSKDALEKELLRRELDRRRYEQGNILVIIIPVLLYIFVLGFILIEM